jgi:Zn ribbon nucleic-acid-binding protein
MDTNTNMDTTTDVQSDRISCPACGESDTDNLLLDLEGDLDEVDCATCGHHYTLKS